MRSFRGILKIKNLVLFFVAGGLVIGATFGTRAEAIVPGVNTLISVNNTGDGQGGNDSSPSVLAGEGDPVISANGKIYYVYE